MSLHPNDFINGAQKAFIAGFLRGFRVWGYAEVEGVPLLRSTAFPNTWKVGRNDAECMSKRAIQQFSTPTCPCPACVLTIDQFKSEWLANKEAFESHEAPSTDKRLCNKCGFYGFHKPEAIGTQTGYVTFSGSHIGGSFKATGSIVLATLGFRAEHVEVEALYGGFADTGRKAADHYGVPWFRTRDELVQQFPFIPVEGHTYEDPPKPELEVDTFTRLVPSGSITATGQLYWQPSTQSVVPMQWKSLTKAQAANLWNVVAVSTDPATSSPTDNDEE
jgi:hypothetical protein